MSRELVAVAGAGEVLVCASILVCTSIMERVCARSGKLSANLGKKVNE
jgi:hypothetical protein